MGAHQPHPDPQQPGIQVRAAACLVQRVLSISEQDAQGVSPAVKLPQRFGARQQFLFPEEEGRLQAAALQRVQQRGQLGFSFLPGQAGEQQGHAALGQHRGGLRRADAAGLIPCLGHLCQLFGVAGEHQAVRGGGLAAGQPDHGIAHAAVRRAGKGEIHSHPGGHDGHRQIGHAVPQLGRHPDGPLLQLVIGQAGIQLEHDGSAHAEDGDQLLGFVVVDVDTVHLTDGGIRYIDDAVDIHRHLAVPHLLQDGVFGDGDEIAVHGITWTGGGKQRQQQADAQQGCQNTAHGSSSFRRSEWFDYTAFAKE